MQRCARRVSCFSRKYSGQWFYMRLSDFNFAQPRRFLLTSAIVNRLAEMMTKYDDLTVKMTQGDIPVDHLGKAAKELNELSSVIAIAQQLKQMQSTFDECTEMIAASSKNAKKDDIELVEFAKSEKQSCEEAIPVLEDLILRALLPRDEADEKNVILEVRAGTGGDESSLFASQMFDMYHRFSISKGWSWQILHVSKTDLGGCREAAARICGENVYSQLKFESGVHRVQRVPINDVRIHTSAMSVAVLPEASEVDIHIDPSDLKIDTYRASGAGGQHVNTTESAVRITHLPTNTVVAIQDERSQHRNKAKAMLILKSRVYHSELERRRKENDSLRQEAMGTGDRSERIRTYNFPQDRVTDHRISSTKHGVENMLNGQGLLDEFISELRRREQDEIISNFHEIK